MALETLPLASQLAMVEMELEKRTASWTLREMLPQRKIVCCDLSCWADSLAGPEKLVCLDKMDLGTPSYCLKIR
jgi:hypothetical protein